MTTRQLLLMSMPPDVKLSRIILNSSVWQIGLPLQDKRNIKPAFNVSISNEKLMLNLISRSLVDFVKKVSS